jgi:hypothetical protein
VQRAALSSRPQAWRAGRGVPLPARHTARKGRLPRQGAAAASGALGYVVAVRGAALARVEPGPTA